MIGSHETPNKMTLQWLPEMQVQIHKNECYFILLIHHNSLNGHECKWTAKKTPTSLTIINTLKDRY